MTSVHLFNVDKSTNSISLYTNPVAAGFPSPADDFIESTLSLDELLIAHPAATFFVRVSGDSMIEAGLFEGDILIVDRQLEPRDGQIVIAVVEGELTVKRLVREKKDWVLKPENHRYPPLRWTNEQLVMIWGVVTTVIHRV